VRSLWWLRKRKKCEVRYPPKRDRLYTVGPEPKGRLAGREHIADVAVGVWEEDEGVD
jgi:hypothetical protein